MKRSGLTAILFLLVALVGGADLAWSGKMDVETHTLVIDKLENVTKGMDSDDKARPGVVQRLADLYSERSRLLFMEEVNQNCDNCKKSREDRQKAIAYYKIVFNVLDKERQERVLLQMAHLHELNNEIKQAEALYLSVLKQPKKHSRSLVGQAHVGLGEIAYRQGQFQKALEEYQKALAIRETSRRGYVTYRSAWCLLNLGKNEKATQTIISILQSPELLQNGRQDEQMDKSFHADVARDLALFLARGNVGPREIELLISNSPDYAVKSNVHALATETERVGKKHSALLVWKEYLKFQSSDIDLLEVQVRLAQIEYDLGRSHRAVQEIADTVTLWQKKGCSDAEVCDELKLRLRNLITEWNKAEKKKPTQNLLKAYSLYVKLFDADVEMHLWAAQLARELSQWRTAIAHFNRASLLAAHELRKNNKDEKFAKHFEAALLGQIEVAEITKSLELREQAYDHYLRQNPTGAKALEVRYQKAQVHYESRKFKSATEQFISVALVDDKAQRDLRRKSADLALDALAVLKDDPLLEKWALEFAKQFPEQRTAYLLTARRAVLAQTAKVANNPSASNREYTDALAKMNAVSLAGASQDELVTYFRNKIILAEKAQDLQTVDRAASEMLKIRKLSEKDRNFALTRRLWVAEMTLDFGRAYSLAQQVDLKELGPEERALKLGLLAELSGRDPEKHYKDYIARTRDARKANEVRARLVKRSRNMWRELDKHVRALQAHPDLLAALTLEAFAQSRDQSRNTRQAEKILAIRGVLGQPAGQQIFRVIFFKDYEQMRSQVSSHRIRTQSNYLVQLTLKQRLDLINKAEKLSGEAVKSRDWTLQILTLDLLAKEYERLFQDVRELPAPAGLTAQQKADYKKLLAQQAAPYQTKAQTLRAKLDDFWKNEKAVESLIEDYKRANRAVSSLIAEEIRQLARVAPGSARRSFERALSNNSGPSREEIISARSDLRQSPFDSNKAERLRRLESAAGGDAMAGYLAARLNDSQRSRR